MDSQALLAHILSQTRQNIDFLVAQNHLSQDAGRQILAQLSPAEPSASVHALADQASTLSVTSEAPLRMPQEPAAAPPVSVRGGPPDIGPRPVKARALWDYNENNIEPNDLSFRAGDTIEIVSETNADWWTGKNNGKQGLFPSNYVEKLPPRPTPSPEPPSASSYTPSSAPSFSPPSAPSYQPPSAFSYNPPSAKGYEPAYGPPSGPPVPVYSPPPPHPQYGGYQSPPPPGPGGPQQGWNGYGQPPPPQNNVQQPPPPQEPAQPPKKHKFGGGGLGNTLAHSAVGGAGFGAGSAIGSNLINSIF